MQNPSPTVRRGPHRLLRASALLLAAGMTVGSAAWAASADGGGLTPQQIYERDRAACLSGQTSQDQASCLREAGAALQERRQGKLGNDVSTEQRQANALQRCQVHQEADARLACERMARGEGKQSGSVSQGGVVKEIVTRSVGEPAKPSGQ